MGNAIFSKYWLKIGDKKIFSDIGTDEYAFNRIATYLSKHPIEDKSALDIGIIWYEEDGTQGDWAVWVNPGSDEEVGGLDGRIGGNAPDFINILRNYYTS